MNLSQIVIVLLLLAAAAAVTRSQVLQRQRSASGAVPPRRSDAGSTLLISSNTMAAAFAKGLPVLERDSFKIMAGRRDAPGIVEIHHRDTDIFHILEGSAMLVTGGTALQPTNTGPDEIRAADIRDGESRRLSKGDVVVIPADVPHWFKTVEGPLLYYVVKVTAPTAPQK